MFQTISLKIQQINVITLTIPINNYRAHHVWKDAYPPVISTNSERAVKGFYNQKL